MSGAVAIMRHLGKVLAWLLVLTLMVTLAQRYGDVPAWQRWTQDNATGLLVWRLGLYLAIAVGWCWIRRRLLQREPQARKRVWRIELGTVLAVVLLEISLLRQA